MAGTYALTSLAKVQTHMKITEDGTLLDRLIDVATATIERYCDRNIKGREYNSWLDGRGGTILYVPNYPIEEMGRVCPYSVDVMSVQNTTAAAGYATAMVDATNLELKLATSSVLTNQKALATYTTINSLVTAVNAIGSNWSAGESNSGTTYISSDIKPGGPWGCLDNAVYLYAPDEPVEEMEWDAASGRIWTSTGFPAGRQNVFVSYTGGYSTVPDDIEQVCLELIKELYDSLTTDKNFRSESLGDYAYTIASGFQMNEDMLARLWSHKRMVLP